ncbi:MAG: thioredoxin-disulfide reductase [Chitinispirillaceae bacterium]|nr:thioredoxin-disulfide reductase [Chitinispirillaceae bacterium]
MDIETVVIAGSGPAGLTAAIYAARAGLKPLVLEGLTPGGQLTVSETVENYPGFPDSLSGSELMSRFRKQAERFDVRFQRGSIQEISRIENQYNLRIKNNTTRTKSLIIATGAQARRLNVPGEKVFYGRGISGCVTCDGAFFKDKKVIVVGGGNTAMHNALYLTRFAKKITILHRRTRFKADIYEVEKAKKSTEIEWMVPWVITDITGDETLKGITARNIETGEICTLECDGIFVAIGHQPKTEVFSSIVKTNQDGYIIVAPNSTVTTAPGIFACGDVCDPVYRQAAVAVGHGCMAAMDAQEYLTREE